MHRRDGKALLHQVLVEDVVEGGWQLVKVPNVEPDLQLGLLLDVVAVERRGWFRWDVRHYEHAFEGD